MKGDEYEVVIDVDEGLEILRELKGSPLALLAALSTHREPMSQFRLECTTGYTDKTVAKALAFLKEKGCVERTPYGWQIRPDSPILVLLVRQVSEMELLEENETVDELETLEEEKFFSEKIGNSDSTTTDSGSLILKPLRISSSSRFRKKSGEFPAPSQKLRAVFRGWREMGLCNPWSRIGFQRAAIGSQQPAISSQPSGDGDIACLRRFDQGQWKDCPNLPPHGTKDPPCNLPRQLSF